MDWTASIDVYCERLGPGFWAEPVNALSNLVFILVAVLAGRRLRGARLPQGAALVTVLCAIGLGSFLFHTFATPWAGLADVVPIVVFVALYLYVANRHMLGAGPGASLVLVAAGLALVAALAPFLALFPGIGSSAAYAPLPLLIAGYGLVLARRNRETARGLAAGAGVLAVSIALRSLDAPLCPVWPAGTHFLWHLFNGAMLTWMIEVYRRHMLAGDTAPR